MREHLERFGPWGVCAAMAYFAWSGLSVDAPPKKPDPAKPPEVPPACLERRSPAEKPAKMRDPFQIDWAPYGPQYAPEYIAEQRQKKEDAEHERIRKENEETLARKRAELLSGPKHENAQVGFTLALDAVSRFGGETIARICGRNVKVGEAIPGLGVDPAPTLVRCDGAAADVEWRGRIVTVRLDDRPVYVAPSASPDAPFDAPAGAPKAGPR